MNIYKYFSLERGTNFLNLPLMRISTSNSLNDPFESEYARSDLKAIEEIYRKKYENHWQAYLKKFQDYGIISLTTNNNNLLMWSHYADEHKGIVIGFDINENNPSDFFYTPTTCRFEKVKYIQSRQFECIINENNLDEVKLHYSILKSNEWNYESEYRFILSYKDADILYLNKKNSFFEETLKILGLNINEVKNDERYAYIDLIENKIEDDKLFMVWFLSSHNGSLFFKIINPVKIKQVFIGKKVDSLSLNKFFTEEIAFGIIKDTFCDENKRIKNVFQGKLDSNEFKISFSECTTSLLDFIN
ncbi:DUF2971 domain-containing protein [Aliarcobacter cryaerophilus]|uniref:DUF2971 domain-containing protein n=1 Tax=Aliarcobacter cryaerophilus TaxID=28198 RepID=UPI003DA235F8